MTQHRPILETLASLKARSTNAPRPIAVYDLDSTLFSTGPRNFAIAKAFTEIRPQLASFVAQLHPDRMGWNVMQDLQGLGFDDQSILKELQAFWRATFFTDRFVQLDGVYLGAVELVRATQAAGCLTFYLTGRDEPGMKAGTLLALDAAGFPMPDGRNAMLRLKPNWEDEDLAFKTKAFEELRQLGEVVLAFENEPANANRFAEAFPRATVVLHATIHAPNPEPLSPRVHRVEHLKLDGLEIP
jgi:hypothetical protein